MTFLLYLAAGSWWLYSAIVVVAAVLAYLTYNRSSGQLSGRMRVVLMALRTVGLSVLVIALFEPMLRSIFSSEEKPSVVIAIDNSASSALRDAGIPRDSVIKQLSETLTTSLGYNTELLSFSELAEPDITDVDSLTFEGHRTDLSAPIRWVSNQREATKPAIVVFVSDGNHNSGENPLHTAVASGLGVYSVVVGDTIPPVDASLTALLTSGIAVVNEPTAMTVTLNAVGLEGKRATIDFVDEGSVFTTDTIALPRNGTTQSISTMWTPKKEGIRKVEARLRIDGKEYTAANNVVRDFIEVRSSKRTIVLYAGAPSPDVSFIRSVLEKDENLNVVVAIEKQGGGFYDLPTQKQLQDAEACVFVGFPTSVTPLNLVEQIAAVCKSGLSLLFVASKDVDYGKLGKFADVLPFSVAASRATEFMVTADVKTTHSDPLMSVGGSGNDAEVWNALPPIYRTETFVTPKAGAKVLATLRVQNVPLDEPLILKRENGKVRSVAIMGYGLYRWKLLGEGPGQSRGEQPVPLFDRFLGNNIKWLSVSENERRVRIRSTRTFYGAGENVQFVANVLNSSLTPVDDATVTVSVTDAAGKQREVVLTQNGGGRYSASMGALPPGSYSYKGVAVVGDNEIGRDNARFEVGQLGIEQSATSANIALMRAMSSRTGALTVVPSRINELVAAIKNDPRLRERAVTTERELWLWQLPWPLAIALLAFSLEWFLRKRANLA